MIRHYFLWFEVLSLIICIFCFPKIRGTILVWFIPFLVLTNIQELGSTIGLMSINGSNVLALNIFTTFEFVFYSWLFYKAAEHLQRKNLIKLITSVLLSFILINLLFVQKFLTFHSYTYLLGSVVMVFYAGTFFYNLMKSDQYIQLTSYPMFWISVGLLFFYTGMFVTYIYFGTLAERYEERYITLFNIFTNIFNIILYTCFSISFLCSKKPRDITS